MNGDFTSHRSARCVQAVAGAGAVLDAVYLDYFRFPGAYIEIYGGLIRNLLPALIRGGLVAPNHTRIILPNRKDLINLVNEQQKHMYLQHPITADDYPLCVATNRVAAMEEDSQLLGGYTLESEIKHAGLDAAFPFVRLLLQ